MWSAALDPSILSVSVTAVRHADAEVVVLSDLAPWLTIVEDLAGAEHALLSDGRHHIRLDVEDGRLTGSELVSFRYRMEGLASAEAGMLPLRRFLSFCRLRRFQPALFPADPAVARGIELLRVHDALQEGASHRDIAYALYGGERAAAEWGGASDALRCRMKRLVCGARAMAAGGYRHLLRKAVKR